MQPPETITVETEKLYCDGGDGPAGERLRGAQSEPVSGGHPRVFLTMTKKGSVDCPYCGRHYVLDAAAVGKVAAH